MKREKRLFVHRASAEDDAAPYGMAWVVGVLEGCHIPFIQESLVLRSFHM